MTTTHQKCPIQEAVEILGWKRAAKTADVSLRAVRKWVENGRLPRTEATGETQYAERLAAADPRISKQRLLATVVKMASA